MHYLKPKRAYHINSDNPNPDCIVIHCDAELCRAIEVMPYWERTSHIAGRSVIHCIVSPVYDKTEIVAWLNTWLSEQTSAVTLSPVWGIDNEEAQS